MADDSPVTHPRETTGLVGHGAAEAELRSAWDSGRMPHAWLLTGPRGIGKATLAYRLARFALAGGPAAETGLFGDAPTGLEVDLGLKAARLVLAGTHPDLQVIERTASPSTGKLRETIVVDDVARLASLLHLTPAGGGWRVVIVDSVDEMNANSANMLLKLLEEPPANSLLVLVNHAPGRVPVTIRSRCRRLKLAPLERSNLEDLLRHHDPDLEAEAAALAVSLAEGSVGRALAVARGDGLAVLRDAAGLLEGEPALDRQALHAVTEGWIRQSSGEGATPLADRLELVLWWAGRGLRAMASGEGAEAMPGDGPVFERLIARHGLAGLAARIDRAGRQVREDLALRLNPKQIAMTLLLTLAE